MIYWGVLQNGEQLLLGRPEEAVLSYDREAPADQLKAVFPADRVWPELAEVLAYREGQGVFRGIVDEQNTRLTGSGLSVELVCRSREALLLDNEAEPGTIRNLSAEALSRRLLEPLGLRPGAGLQPAAGSLFIEKGTSCWTVLADFCRDYLGTKPYVDFEGVVHWEEPQPRRLELGQVVSAEIARLPCRRLSALWKQGCLGGYDTLYSAGEAGIPRRRYLSMENAASPRELLEESARESFRLTVTCAGSWWPARGLASVTVPLAGRYENCPVRRAVYSRDKNGERTRLVLEKGGAADVADPEIGR